MSDVKLSTTRVQASSQHSPNLCRGAGARCRRRAQVLVQTGLRQIDAVLIARVEARTDAPHGRVLGNRVALSRTHGDESVEVPEK